MLNVYQAGRRSKAKGLVPDEGRFLVDEGSCLVDEGSGGPFDWGRNEGCVFV